jgi:A/G-specific adenine glycosylase
MLNERIFLNLIDWFEKNKRDFPWRLNRNPYWTWISEIMSQQTQMATLLPYFNRFVEAFPSVQALAEADERAVLANWAGLGYYSRARNLHRAAQFIVQKYNKEFPRSYLEWLECPGVGPYTAAAIASQVFEERVVVWDGNVHRVYARLKADSKSWTSQFVEKSKGELQEILKKNKQLKASQFNEALMELGATVCTPKNAKCERCPLQRSCLSFKNKIQDSIPGKKPSASKKEVHCNVFIEWKRKPSGEIQVFLEERERDEWFSGFFDFISELGGVKNPRLKPKADLLEKKLIKLSRVKHSITHHKITLTPVLLYGQKIRFRKKGKWISLELLTRYEEKNNLPLATTARKVTKVLFREFFK